MAMSLKMARWLDQMGAAADKAARLTFVGKGDQLVVLPNGTEVPGVQHDDGVTAIAAVDLLRAVVADHERTDDEDDDDVFIPPTHVTEGN